MCKSNIYPGTKKISRRESRRGSRGRRGRDSRRVLRIHILRGAVRVDGRGVVEVDVQLTARATELALVAGAKHIALAGIERRGRGRERAAAETLLGELEAGVVGPGRLAEGDAALDRHAGAVAVRGAAEEAAGGRFGVAALGDVAADLLDGRGWDVGGGVVDAQSAGAAADFARVAGAGHVAACEAQGAV